MKTLSKKNKFNPLVSIVIPVYNGSNYVREAIDSALAQTYKNIEIIVVNDGSTDNTEKIVKSYGKKIRYYKKENGGVASALNLAIKKAKGDYISWLSHDDIYYVAKIEKQVELIRNINYIHRYTTVIYSNYSLINNNSRLTAKLNFEKQHMPEKLNNSLYPLLNGLINGCTLLIPKRFFYEVGLFNENLKATQDYDLWFRIFPECKLIFMKEHLVHTRIHDQQGTKTITSATTECSALWISMISKLSTKQKILLAGSEIEFYKRVYKIVRGSKYLDAEKFVKRIIDKYTHRDISHIKVSVVIPFYDDFDNLSSAIKSVLYQTHENIELILVDDCSSTDTTAIKRFLSDKRVKYYRNSRQMGPGYSRNIGIRMASGEFIAFLDSDDQFVRSKIKTQLNVMVTNAHTITHTSYFRMKHNKRMQESVESGITSYEYPKLISDCAIATPTVMVHRNIFVDKDNRFPTDFMIGEDTCFWIRLARITPIIGITEKLTNVYVDSETSGVNTLKQIKGLSNVSNYVLEHFMNDGLNELLLIHANIASLISKYSQMKRYKYAIYKKNSLFTVFLYLQRTNI